MARLHREAREEEPDEPAGNRRSAPGARPARIGLGGLDGDPGRTVARSAGIATAAATTSTRPASTKTGTFETAKRSRTAPAPMTAAT